MNDASAPWLSTMTHELSLNLVYKQWQWQVGGEHYRNELTEDQFKNMLLLDTKLIFKPTKQVELSASLINIFNKRQYSYITYSQLSSFESCRSLRGRQLLVSIAVHK